MEMELRAMLMMTAIVSGSTTVPVLPPLVLEPPLEEELEVLSATIEAT